MTVTDKSPKRFRFTLVAKIYGNFVLTKDHKEEPTDMTGETLVIE